jgi:hypothetical protein
MKRKAIFRTASFIFLCVVPTTLKAQYQPDDLKTGKRQVKNILILPPEANVVKTSMKGSEPLLAEAQALGAEISPIVREILAKKGCNILPDAFGPDTLEQNSDLKYALSDLQTQYDNLRVLVMKRPKDVRSGRFSLGDEVINLSQGAAADGLVFVRARGTVPTTGLKTFVVLTGMGIAYSHVSLDISVVDAQTGTILYFVKQRSSGNFVESQQNIRVAVSNSFSGFRSQYPPDN